MPFRACPRVRWFKFRVFLRSRRHNKIHDLGSWRQRPYLWVFSNDGTQLAVREGSNGRDASAVLDDLHCDSFRNTAVRPFGSDQQLLTMSQKKLVDTSTALRYWPLTDAVRS